MFEETRQQADSLKNLLVTLYIILVVCLPLIAIASSNVWVVASGIRRRLDKILTRLEKLEIRLTYLDNELHKSTEVQMKIRDFCDPDR